ncbi:MAG: DUF2339 domain-containing protein [Actinomycetota bacterium]|nr:DUF2339 domain-containing protein [Actinomycetota bacterium]
MSVVDDRRIEALERRAQSLSDRVYRLESDAATGLVPGPARRPGTSVAVAAPAGSRSEPPLALDLSRSAPVPDFSGSAPAPIKRAATPATPSTPSTSHQSQRFEDLLGGRMLAWLGGLSVVVGLALFFAYAISRGWIGESARVLAGGVTSLALLGFGIWLHEHRARTDAASTVAAAAVAGLFMTAVVASRVYAVIPVGAGFALALASGVAGAALAVRWNAKVIGAIGIIGALLAPVLVGAPDDGATLVVLFAAALSAVGALLWCRWDWLGAAVLLVCAPQWLAWLLNRPSLGGALVALVAFGALGHAAAIGFELRLPASVLRPSSSLLLALNAAVLAIAGYGALIDLGHSDAARLWIAALAAAHLALALLAGRRPRVCADIRLLLLTLGVLLGDVALALLVDGPVLAAGWAGASVLFTRLAARSVKRAHGRTLAELGLGGHVAGALLVAISQATPIGLFGAGTGDQVAATIALAAVAAAAFTSARLTSTTTTSNQRWRVALDTVGLAVLAYLTAVDLHGAGLVVAWALEAAALARIARRSGDDVAAIASLTFLAGGAIHALAVEAPPRALALGVSGTGAAAAAIGACAAASLMIARTRLTIRDRGATPALIGAASLALLYLASVLIVSAFQPSAIETGDAVLDMTVRQQGQILLSGVWGLAGVGVLVLGLRRNQRLWRLGALGVLLLTAGKVFLYDLSTLDSIYRIASFVALGLLLLLGAYAYQRLRPAPPPDLRTVPPALR